MKAVMISIRPEWCEKIASGKKTIEVRKTKPKLDPPFKCYIYCTLPPKSELFTHGCIREYANELIRLQSGEIVYSYGMQLCCDPEDRPYSKDNFLCQKVIGEFVCDAIVVDKTFGHDPMLYTAACMTPADIAAYCVNSEMYGWHISELKIYDKPKDISEFITPSEVGCCNEGKCRGCHYLDRGNGFNIEDDCTADFDTDNYKPLRKAPQSWCYVEENADAACYY